MGVGGRARLGAPGRAAGREGPAAHSRSLTYLSNSCSRLTAPSFCAGSACRKCVGGCAGTGWVTWRGDVRPVPPPHSCRQPLAPEPPPAWKSRGERQRDAVGFCVAKGAKAFGQAVSRWPCLVAPRARDSPGIADPTSRCPKNRSTDCRGRRGGEVAGHPLELLQGPHRR